MLHRSELSQCDCAGIANVNMLNVRGLTGERKLGAQVPCA